MAEKPTGHRPEFVSLEDKQGFKGTEETFQRHQYFESLLKMKSAHYPLPIRAMIFVSALLYAGFSLIAGLITFVFFLFTTVTLFQISSLKRNLISYWEWSKKGFVISLGFFIAAFNPPYGFGMILLYFVLYGQTASADEAFIRMVIRKISGV